MTTDLTEARTRKETARAKLLELQLEVQRGKLIDRVNTEKAIFERARLERDAWLNLPARVAPALAAELGCSEHTLLQALDREIRDELTRLAETPFELRC